MNNILLAEDINNLSNGEYSLAYHKDIMLNVEGKIFLSDFSKDNYNISINIQDNADVNFDKVNVLNKDINIVINIENNTNLVFNWLIINNGHNKACLTINMLGNNNKVEVHLRTINKNKESNLDVICDGIIKEETKENVFLEDLKGLLLNDSTIKISPNMLVGSNDVLANHLVTIGYLDLDMLFYLKSRGLSEKVASKLLLISFMCSLMNDEIKKLIQMEVNDFE